MALIRTIRTDSMEAPRQIRELREPLRLEQILAHDPPELRTVRQIVEDVRTRGDEAVAQATERADGVTLRPDQFRVEGQELIAARDRLTPALRNAVRTSIANVRRFQKHTLVRTREALVANGTMLQSRYRPLSRVGVCVPGAVAPLLSSAIHCVVPAQVAGVRQIVLIAPPRHEGNVHPSILGVAAELGLTEVYRISGAQAVAALAFGTKTIPRVDKVVGPGSVYTQLAKKLLFGVIDIDMFAGPSEVVIIADSSANAAHVAADLLSQAEHDPGAAMLLTPDESLSDRVAKELGIQLRRLKRRDAAERCLREYGALIVVRNIDEAIELTNEFAPEHLEIQAEDAQIIADRIDSAGAIFLGAHSPEATGDYTAGPSHVLPTGGSARFFSGLSCNDFLRRTSILRYTAAALERDADAIVALAEAEGLDAHARSVRVRRGTSSETSLP